MAALLAAANEVLPDAPVVSLKSEGVILIYGRDEEAVEAFEPDGLVRENGGDVVGCDERVCEA